MKTTVALTTLCILTTVGLNHSAAGAPTEIIDRDSPFNGGLKVPATPGGIDPADTHPGLNLIPWPKALEVKPGQMPLTAASRIVSANPSIKPLADILAGEIQLLTGLQLTVTDGPARAADIILKVEQSIKADEPILAARPPDLVRTTDGAHTINIDQQAVVAGFDYRALAEGTATLLQAIGQANGKVTLPKLVIKDWPHADYCGLMVDVGRQSNPATELKKMVEACRMYKVRYLQLHLTDDQGWCFPSTKYPQLGSKPQGPTLYKMDELKDLVAYADARGIAIVPELEMPGHSGSALSCLPEIFDAINPETKEPINLGCMNMANEEIYPALDTIIGEMCDVFKSTPYFHIGTDEASMGRLPLHSGYKAFMAKHNLKNDGELGNYFIAQVNEMIKKRGKKTIKWEGMGVGASKDIIVMPWILRSNQARVFLDQGITTITAPWDLEMPWTQWSMYECNNSKIKKGESVLGATAIAWEMAAPGNLHRARAVAGRQERTWGPDNTVTEAGFLARFQALDAAVGRLIGQPPRRTLEATFAATAGTRDLLLPEFTLDGDPATFYQSAPNPKAGDTFTITLAKAALVATVEVLTGSNGKGMADAAELQVSSDGAKYVTVAKLSAGTAKAVLSDNKVTSIRLLCPSSQNEPVTIREIKLQLMVEVSGMIESPGTILSGDTIGVIQADTTIKGANASCLSPLINKGFNLAFDCTGRGGSYSGPISGTGTVIISQGDPTGSPSNKQFVLEGNEPNTLKGAWQIKSGNLALGKAPGVDALGGTITVGGGSINDSMSWNNSDQVNDAATVELLDSSNGGAALRLNGCTEKFLGLKMAPNTKIFTDGEKQGGVLTVGTLVVAGKTAPKGIYTSALPWISGAGFVIVGDVKRVNTAGVIDNPNTAIGTGNLAVLTAETTFGPATGDCAIPVMTGESALTFAAPADKPMIYSGFVSGNGSVTYTTARNERVAARPTMEITGASSNTYRGTTTLSSGVLKLNKPSGAVALPGALLVGGNAPTNAGDTVLLAADGQFGPAAVLTLNGKTQPCFLDLGGHKTSLARMVIDGQARIRTGSGGQLTVKQIIVDGKKIAAGTHKAPQPWLEGGGSVTIDPRIDVKGEYVVPNKEIGAGNTANMTGDTLFGWQTGACDIDMATNGHKITLDSGAGNALNYSGTISGTGDVALLMAPSSSHLRDTSLFLTGTRPNTTSGKFHIRQGRIQMEKPDGVDAISGDVAVGGQGFNDCLSWLNSNQIKDSSTITLLNAGNSGGAYLNLNGCNETVAALVMATNTMVKTDSPEGKSGVLTIKALTVNNVKKPAGTYTAATEKWLEGKGKIVVVP